MVVHGREGAGEGGWSTNLRGLPVSSVSRLLSTRICFDSPHLLSMRSEPPKYDTARWKSFPISFTLTITLRLRETPLDTIFTLNDIIVVLCLVRKDHFCDCEIPTELAKSFLRTVTIIDQYTNIPLAVCVLVYAESKSAAIVQ